jgi:alpha-N-arabinofuranosidase
VNTGSQLQTLATRDSRTGTLYVTVINPSPLPEPTTVHTGVTARTATVTRLAGTSSSDTNTITDPNHIHPVTRTVHGLGPTFSADLPAYSMTVFTIPRR